MNDTNCHQIPSWYDTSASRENSELRLRNNWRQSPDEECGACSRKCVLQHNQIQRNFSTSSNNRSEVRQVVREVLERADRNVVEVPAVSIIHATVNVGRSLQPHRLHQIANEILLTAKEYKHWSKGFYIIRHPDCGGWISIGGNHRAYISKKPRGYVSAAEVDEDGIRKTLGIIQNCEESNTEIRWDDTALRHVCTEIDDQAATDDCRSLRDEVRRFKQDGQDEFPAERNRLRTSGKLGIEILSKSVVEFFKVVWYRPIEVGGDRLSKCVPRTETYLPINLPLSSAKA